ncbi:MAG TPA: hypothetical protein EYQ78_05565 [Candidatus Poseidoniales archaeon]|nr:hypothetical protein [Candidatus Poseidoniales archaeon]
MKIQYSHLQVRVSCYLLTVVNIQWCFGLVLCCLLQQCLDSLMGWITLTVILVSSITAVLSIWILKAQHQVVQFYLVLLSMKTVLQHQIT